MSRARLNQHQHFLYYTDLEPDDVVSIMVFADRISIQAESSATPLNIAFMVGEGNAAIKMARMQKIVSDYKKINLFKNTEISFIQGYSDFKGAQKDFATDGSDVLSQDEIDTAKKLPASPHSTACQQVKDFLKLHDNTLVIGLKPVREFIDIYSEDNATFNNHTFACTGSYNFRTTFWDPKTKMEIQQKLVNLLKSFSKTYLYETYSTTELNSTSSTNTPAFFSLVEQSDNNSILGKLRMFIKDWVNHMLSSDRQKLPASLDKLAATPEEKKTLIELLSSNHNPAAEKILRDFASSRANNAEVASFNRTIGKWKSITQTALQFVNADPGLIAVLTEDCDAHVTAQAATIDFEGDYTTLKPATPSCNTYVYLPGAEMTLDKYLQIRQQEKEQKNKSPELKVLQETLFNNINGVISGAGKTIHELSLRHQPRISSLTNVRVDKEESSSVDLTKNQHNPF